jgi:tRNA A-37 threonylcarbamoyl transferase component Bud32
MEYLPEFETLDDLSAAAVERHAVDIFASLQAMHEAGFAHGDLRSENVLVSKGDLYFIDATKVDEANLADARAYDIACALAVLEPLVGTTAAVQAALSVYGPEIVLTAREFLDFVNIRPDHDFDVVGVKGELDKSVDP